MEESEKLNNIIDCALAQPKDAIFWHLSRELVQAFPNKTLLETDHYSFSAHRFASEGQCERRDKENVHRQWDFSWDGFHEQLGADPYNVWHSVRWQDNDIDVLEVGILGLHCREVRHFILADTQKVAEDFFEAVCRWNEEVRGEILVFENGCWSKSKDLFESVKKTSLDSLVLAGTLKEEISKDFQQFFECKDSYAKYGIPWKRGVLFLGPPGNGKTHAIKGLVNLLNRPCLYVRSFKTEYQTDHYNISQAFHRARQSAPCLFVLEDLDSLIDNDNRSFFLNELDGFYSNEGMLTVATSNHPERLDPAILDRPSRFDRKYAFNLPELSERRTYLKAFSDRLEPELRLTEQGLENVAKQTDEYSYAYLKELFLSAMMQWIANPSEKTMDAIMLAQCVTLREQMKTAQEIPEMFDGDGAEEFPPHIPRAARKYWRQMQARMRIRR